MTGAGVTGAAVTGAGVSVKLGGGVGKEIEDGEELGANVHVESLPMGYTESSA